MCVIIELFILFQVIQDDKYKAEERNLFVYFYTAPETLQKTVANLLRHVEGEKNLQKNK